MKTLDDGTTIPSRVWYYILDFNDHDSFKTLKSFGIMRLSALNKAQFLSLFETAYEYDKTPI